MLFITIMLCRNITDLTGGNTIQQARVGGMKKRGKGLTYAQSQLFYRVLTEDKI